METEGSGLEEPVGGRVEEGRRKVNGVVALEGGNWRKATGGLGDWGIGDSRDWTIFGAGNVLKDCGNGIV